MVPRLLAFVLLIALPLGGQSAPAAAANRADRADRADGAPRSDRDVVAGELRAALDRDRDGDRHDVLVSTRPGARPAVATSRRFRLVEGFSARLTGDEIEELAASGDVTRIEADERVHAMNDGARRSFGVDAAQAAVPSLDGAGLVAAVIDTGIDATHADLADKVVAWKDFVAGAPAPYDDNGHGTHVAATIAGTGAASDGTHRGVAPAAKLVGLKVLDGAGSGSMSNVIAALDWVVANKDTYGIGVVNLSLGAGGCSSGSDTASSAVDRASNAGLVVVVAAGNAGPGKCTIGSPAAARTAVTVGAMADTTAGGFALASFSSRGPTADGRVKPDVVAPGVSIRSAAANSGSGYSSSSGTSMATPFVAGVALLLKDAEPALSTADVKRLITSTAVDWGLQGADGEYGAGRLDVVRALEAAGAAVAPAESVPHLGYTGTLTTSGAVHRYEIPVLASSTPLAATLILTNLSGSSASTPNFDLRLVSPSGTVAASATTNRRQDSLAVVPSTAGTYVLEVRSASGVGPYVVDVSAPVAPDTTPPSISGRTPLPDATGVATTAPVEVTFSEAMAAGNEDALVVDDSAGNRVAGTRAWVGTKLVFTPAAPLHSLETYTVSLAGTITDAAGNALGHDVTWSFRTGGTWSRTTASPATASVETGSFVTGTATSLHRDDGRYYRVASPTTGTPRVVSWHAGFEGISSTLRNATLRVRTKASTSCTQAVSAYDAVAGAWVPLHSRSVSTYEATVSITLAEPSRFVAGDGTLTVRVACTASRTVYSYGEMVSLTYERLV